MKKILYPLTFMTSCLAFDGSPWTIEPLKPDVKALYSYGFFSNIKGYDSNFNNNQLLLTFNVGLPEKYQIGFELDQDASTFNHFYFRAAVVDLKKQITDDVSEGDFFSFSTGIRGIAQTPEGRLDPATLYPGGYHFLGYASIGKEWSFQPDHYVNFWVLGGLGIATHASLWANFEGYIFYRCQKHQLKLSAVSNLGYGEKLSVNIDHFHGWGHTRYRYLDIGLTYGYELAHEFYIKGTFAKRGCAQVMPSNYNYFSLCLEKIF